MLFFTAEPPRRPGHTTLLFVISLGRCPAHRPPAFYILLPTSSRLTRGMGRVRYLPAPSYFQHKDPDIPATRSMRVVI